MFMSNHSIKNLAIDNVRERKKERKKKYEALDSERSLALPKFIAWCWYKVNKFRLLYSKHVSISESILLFVLEIQINKEKKRKKAKSSEHLSKRSTQAFWAIGLSSLRNIKKCLFCVSK